MPELEASRERTCPRPLPCSPAWLPPSLGQYEGVQKPKSSYSPTLTSRLGHSALHGPLWALLLTKQGYQSTLPAQEFTNKARKRAEAV